MKCDTFLLLVKSVHGEKVLISSIFRKSTFSEMFSSTALDPAWKWVLGFCAIDFANR